MRRTSRPAARFAALLAATGLLAVPASAAPFQAGATETQDEEEFAPQLFQLYDTQAARAYAGEALEHIGAERWPEAVAVLQALIEEHEGEVLGGERPIAAGSTRPSEMPVHAGAGAWAVARLFELPAEGRELYRRRFGARADAALERALESGDRGALTRLAERWPLTAAATSAWWALGDLEAELGHHGDAQRAWARAAGFELGRARVRIDGAADWQALRDEVAAGTDAGAREGALARIDFALTLLPTLEGERTSTGRDEASFVRGPANSVAATNLDAGGSSPRRGTSADEWPRPYELPDGPLHARGGAGRVFPQRFGDLVIVNTTRSVHALDAYDGTERWRLDESQLGWDRIEYDELKDFEAAVDTEERIATVAASRGVVVAPVQIPLFFQKSQDFHDLEIIEIIPERRLVAFDAATGAALWNTFPSADWDGDSGSFSERMTVVGPPTIVGARVLVPMARLRGRIELHLGCFDLGTGDVLWSAPLVTGQRELNMFGRSTGEFSAPPPVVAGDTVVMLTQLGLIAAVDLFTGEVLWDSIYEQVGINGPQYYQAGWMASAWRNAPPIVSGDTVIAAPQDGRSLIGVDLATGSVLWSLDQQSIGDAASVPTPRGTRGHGNGTMALVAADDRHVLFGGYRVFSLVFERGLRTGTNTGRIGMPPWRVDWAWPSTERRLSTEFGYPTVDEDSVFVPAGTRLVRLERSTGRELEDVSGQIGSGQLLVSRGMLFSSNSRSVHGRFDWLAMVERARDRAESPDATPRDATTLSRLLLERARGLLDQGGRPSEAVELAREAASVVERFGAREPRSDGGVRLGAGELRETLLRALFTEVRAERLRGGTERALALTEDAATLGVGLEAELDARLLRYSILRDRASNEERLASLEELDRGAAGRRVRIEATRPDEDWSSAALFRAALDAGPTGAGAAGLWRDPWDGRPTPKVASLAHATERTRVTADVPVEVFTALERVEMGRATGGNAGLALELDALHALAAMAEADLFGTPQHLYARTRIQVLRTLRPDAPAFEAIEALANDALYRAARASEVDGSSDALARVEDHFPGSGAARRAAALRVEFALENGSAEEIASIVINALPPEWSPSEASERDVDQLAKLAGAMGRAGNRPFEIGLLGNLAHFAPDARLDGGAGPTTVEALAAARARTEGPAPVAAPSFDAKAVRRGWLRDDFLGVATVPGEGADAPLGIFASEDTLLAVVSGTQGVLRWEAAADLGLQTFGRADRVRTFGRDLIVAEQTRVASLDGATGEERWEFFLPGRQVRELAVADGVVVATLGGIDARQPTLVYGIDAKLGVELWRLGPIDGRYANRVVVGDGIAAFLPLDGTDAELHDLFTGHLVALASTGRVEQRNATLAWIEDGRLVVPILDGATLKSKGFDNAIRAFDVHTGAPLWRIDLDRVRGTQRALIGLIDMPRATDSAERVRLAMLERRADPRGALPRSTAFDLFPIDAATGRLVESARLEVAEGQAIVGVRRRHHVSLQSPVLTVLTGGERGRPTRIRAVGPDLEDLFHVAWPRRLAVPGAENLGAPVLGDGVLAVPVREVFGTGRTEAYEVKLAFLDAATGEPLETRLLRDGNERRFGRGREWARLFAFGGSLAVTRTHAMEILESDR